VPAPAASLFGRVEAARSRRTDRPLRGRQNEIDDLLHLGDVAPGLARLPRPSRDRSLRLVEDGAEGRTQGMDVGARYAAALQADEVEPGQLGVRADGNAVGNDVRVAAGNTAEHRTAPDAAELLHRREPAQNDAVADIDMAAQLGAVGESHIIPDPAIVADVAVGHEEAARPDFGDAVALGAAQAEGNAFADHGVLADDKARACRIVAADLRFAAQHGIGMNNATRADHRAAHDDRMRYQPHPVAQPHIASDNAEWADLDARSQRGAVFNDCGWMNRHLRRHLCRPGSWR
jgi:hypothetical protein